MSTQNSLSQQLESYTNTHTTTTQDTGATWWTPTRNSWAPSCEDILDKYQIMTQSMFLQIMHIILTCVKKGISLKIVEDIIDNSMKNGTINADALLSELNNILNFDKTNIDNIEDDILEVIKIERKRKVRGYGDTYYIDDFMNSWAKLVERRNEGMSGTSGTGGTNSGIGGSLDYLYGTDRHEWIMTVDSVED